MQLLCSLCQHHHPTECRRLFLRRRYHLSRGLIHCINQLLKSLLRRRPPAQRSVTHPRTKKCPTTHLAFPFSRVRTIPPRGTTTTQRALFPSLFPGCTMINDGDACKRDDARDRRGGLDAFACDGSAARRASRPAARIAYTHPRRGPPSAVRTRPAARLLNQPPQKGTKARGFRCLRT